MNVRAGFDALLEDLRAAAAIIDGPLGARDQRERAEGYRHLLRLLNVATEMLLEKGDPQRPELTRWMSPHRKLLGDNPGTVYDAAVIDPTATYRLWGDRGEVDYLGVCVYGTGADGSRRIVAAVDDTDLGIDADGRFELWLAPEGAPVADGATVLRLAPDATDVMVRQYHDGPPVRPASYTLERVPDPGPPPPLDEQTLSDRLRAVGRFVRDTLEVEATLTALIAQAAPAEVRGADPDQPPPPVDPAVVAKAMPSPAIQYSGTWIEDLADDEIVEVEGVVPACRYWSVVLLDRWMQSLDYRYHPVAVTGGQVGTPAGAPFRITIAHRDPGTRPWLDTTGLRHLGVAVRALAAEGPLEVRFRRRRLTSG